MSADGWKKFEEFDWSDEGWCSYLEGLYPPPNPKQTLKFKKKWYKKNIDPDFDDSYEPTPPPATPVPPGVGGSSDSGSDGATPSAKPADPPAPALPSAAFANGTQWQVMGKKGSICFSAYAYSMTMAIGAFACVVSPYRALVLLEVALMLDILAKYGLKLKTEYMHFVLMDDIGAPIMISLTMLTPGLHPYLRILALTSPFLSALLSFSQICKNHSTMPGWVQEFFAPLAEPAARFKVMRVRGHIEVAFGIVLMASVFVAMAAPFAVLMFWNVMMMRYMMSHWTQQAFQDIDDILKPRCERIPGMKQGYAALKSKLYGFVDPESSKSGRLCTIL